MSDEEKGTGTAATRTGSGEEGGRLNTLFIKKPAGYIIIINFVSK